MKMKSMVAGSPRVPLMIEERSLSNEAEELVGRRQRVRAGRVAADREA
jgi:hypothetical protein